MFFVFFETLCGTNVQQWSLEERFIKPETSQHSYDELLFKIAVIL